MATTGKIGVTTENIFPVIKKFLYSDHEIFLRELVANAVDATRKMEALAASGEFSGELGELSVRIELDEKKRTLKIIDRGIGMTAEEVEKYINQIAFSSAGEFLEKYKDQLSSIIGHFGLGFYSAFMVAEKVTIETLSWKDGSKAVKWSCDGSPEYEMEECVKEDRGTVITLYIAEDEKEFAEKNRIEGLLGKYCKFMPVPVIFGKEQEWKDGKYVDTDKDNVINKVEPLWARKPADLKDEDKTQYEDYRKNGGSMNISQWRRENVNALVSAMYLKVKSYGEDKIFSVSPSGNIDKNYSQLYADVSLWCKGGYCDMVLPQIYFGFQNESLPFEECLDDWLSITDSEKVILIPALALYKSGKEDTFAGSGKDEWINNNDIISRQVKLIKEKNCKGFALYSSSYINFSEKFTAQELKNLQNML